MYSNRTMSHICLEFNKNLIKFEFANLYYLLAISKNALSFPLRCLFISLRNPSPELCSQRGRDERAQCTHPHGIDY